jgi:hypothetical protein
MQQQFVPCLLAGFLLHLVFRQCIGEGSVVFFSGMPSQPLQAGFQSPGAQPQQFSGLRRRGLHDFGIRHLQASIFAAALRASVC